jgi:hypothetical protein
MGTMGVTMAHTLRLKRIYRRNQPGMTDMIAAVAGAVAAEHELALRAAEKAASPRKNLAEVRAMYVSASEPPADSRTVEQTSARADTTD